jgi:1,4-dihydroxy-2-naphthoate polyprenyltransferase
LKPPTPITPAVLARALRLPFLGASLLPFVAGSLLPEGRPDPLRLTLGGLLVAANHLGANLLNDYADSRSGADWQDPRFFGLFGGSKLIQEGVLAERFYLGAALGCFGAALLLAAALAVLLKSLLLPALYAGVLLLSWSYSGGPLRLSYRGLGEPVILILFGPALVMGGTMIQTGELGLPGACLLGLPFGMLTMAILFVNEVPDCPQDAAAGKRTWVVRVGRERAPALALTLLGLAVGTLAWAVAAGVAGPVALGGLLLVPWMRRVRDLLQAGGADKHALLAASRLTMIIQTAVAVLLLVDASL